MKENVPVQKVEGEESGFLRTLESSFRLFEDRVKFGGVIYEKGDDRK